MIRAEVVCDRCGETAEMVEDDVTPEGWEDGIIYLRGVTGPEPDLCPDCVSSLTEWWRRGDSTYRGLAEQQDAGGFVVTTTYRPVDFQVGDRVHAHLHRPHRHGTVESVDPLTVLWDDGWMERVANKYALELVEP